MLFLTIFLLDSKIMKKKQKYFTCYLLLNQLFINLIKINLKKSSTRYCIVPLFIYIFVMDITVYKMVFY